MRRLTFILIVMLILSLLISNVSAASGAININGIEKAIDLAMDNDSSLKLFDQRILLAERNYEKARLDSKEAAGKYWNDVKVRISNKKTEILIPLEKSTIIDDLRWQKENAISNLRLNVISLYYRIQQKDSQITYQTKAITQAVSELNTQKTKVEKGLAAESTILPLEISVDNAKASLSNLNSEKSSLVMELNFLLGIDLTSDLKFSTLQIPNNELIIKDIDSLIEKNISAAHSITKLETEIMLTETEKKIYSDYSIGDRPDEIDDLELEIQNLKYSLRDERISIERSIRTDFNNLLNKLDTIKINKMSYEKSQKQLAISEKRNKLGLTSAVDHNKVVLACEQASIAYNNALVDYFLASETFKNNYFIDVVLSDN